MPKKSNRLHSATDLRNPLIIRGFICLGGLPGGHQPYKGSLFWVFATRLICSRFGIFINTFSGWRNFAQKTSLMAEYMI